MITTTAILSLLHEPAGLNSATRAFRGRPVLAWTLDRLARMETGTQLVSALILCHADQYDAIAPIAQAAGARVHARPRFSIPALDAISAAQRWADGWRGGLLGTCHFDRGFHAPSIQAALPQVSALDTQHLILLVDPSSALIDPALLDQMIAHAADHPARDLFFTQAAPGLAGVILRPALLDRLTKAATHPGRLLAYHPDTPGQDPITTDMCVPVPAPLARTTRRFTLDSDRQVARLAAATASLNGQLSAADAASILAAVDAHAAADEAPREVTLKLTTRRASRPTFAATTHLELTRSDLTIETLDATLAELKDIDDLRLTLGGAGDPLFHPRFPEILGKITAAGVLAVHVETDLLELSEAALQAMVAAPIDVLSVHLPAATPATYAAVMGIDGHAMVIANLKRLLAARKTLPIVVPTFTKCRANLDEMEAWYDHWTRVLGAAVITAPTTFAGQIPDHAVADMSPATRRPCARLHARMSIHADGVVPSCEQDVTAMQPIGRIGTDTLTTVWVDRLGSLRRDHARGDLAARPLCLACKEWHRP